MSYILWHSFETCRKQGIAAFIKKALNYPFTIWYAFFNLRALRRDAARSPEELIAFVFDGYRGMIVPIQARGELLELVKILDPLKPKKVLEIGTATGGTLYLFSRIASRDASIISVDLPCGRFGGGYAFWRIPLYKFFARPGQKMHLIRGDSHERHTFAKVETILGGEKLDLLYIDGDHTYEGVKKDFEMYGPLVRKGGYIVMHDIAVDPSKEGCEVCRFWEEIKPGFKHREILLGDGRGSGGLGIGIIRVGDDEIWPAVK